MGTLFPASRARRESRKRWMLPGLRARGRIVVDEGAARALLAQGRSLLPAGVRQVHGPFERGDTVPVYDHEGHRIAIGITNYGHEDAAKLCGVRSDRIVQVLGYEYGSELVHRNNLVKL
jgi:glutamate 5-kinase